MRKRHRFSEHTLTQGLPLWPAASFRSLVLIVSLHSLECRQFCDKGLQHVEEEGKLHLSALHQAACWIVDTCSVLYQLKDAQPQRSYFMNVGRILCIIHTCHIRLRRKTMLYGFRTDSAGGLVE